MRKFSPVQTAYAEALAWHQTVTTIEKNCKIKVLSEHEFLICDDDPDAGQRILDPIGDYNMSESDFDTYCQLCFAEYQAKGIAPKDYQTVATHEAWKALKDTEMALLAWGHDQVKTLPQYRGHQQDIMHLFEKVDYHMEIKEKLIDTIMHLAA